MGGAAACPVRLVRVRAFVRGWVIVRVRVLVSFRVVIRLRVILGVDAAGTRRNSRHTGKPATLTFEPAPGQSTRRARPDGRGDAAPARRAIRAAGAAERPVLMRHRRHRSAALPAVAGEYRARRVAITRRVEVTNFSKPSRGTCRSCACLVKQIRLYGCHDAPARDSIANATRATTTRTSQSQCVHRAHSASVETEGLFIFTVYLSVESSKSGHGIAGRRGRRVPFLCDGASGCAPRSG